MHPEGTRPGRVSESTRLPTQASPTLTAVSTRDRMVSVVFTKWGDRPHWHFECAWLGEDVFGVWLAGRPGTRLQRGDEPAIVEAHGFVQLVPRQGEWMAFFNVAGPFEVYVDVTTAPIWTGRTVACVDLDLDVVRRPNGEVQLLDEDEFMSHQVELEYPAGIIQQARATAYWLLDVVAARHEPFRSTGLAWLAAQPWAGTGSLAKRDDGNDDSVG